MKIATPLEIVITLHYFGLHIEEWCTGDYGASWEFATGIGLPKERLRQARHRLHQRGVGSQIKMVSNPESPHHGWPFLHITRVPKVSCM